MFEKKISIIIIWPGRPRAKFCWKTIREKVPYEGHTRRSDRAGKTCMALLEMRTALLQTLTSTAKSSPKWVMKVNILRANFTIQANRPMQNFFSRQLTPKTKKLRNSTLLANEEAHNLLISQQANRRSRKQLFRINCPIDNNLWNKPTVFRRNFFPWRASKNSLWVKSKKTEEENKVRYKWFLRVYSVSGRSWLNVPEKPQTYLVCSRINCSVVSTSVLLHYRTVHPDNKTRLCLTV